MAKENRKPIKDFRAGNIQAAIWRNEVEKDGQTVVRHSVRIQKRFRKDDGSYENSDYYFPDELARLALVARKCHEFIVLSESNDADEAVPV
jgi:hypothetical protein